MKITYAQLRNLIRHELLEAPEKKKKQEKEKEWWDYFFCPRHKVSLIPRWRKIETKSDVGPDGQPLNDPMRLKAHKFIQPATKDHPELLPRTYTEKKRIVQWIYCPLMEEEDDSDPMDQIDLETGEFNAKEPYLYNPKTGNGRKCDYRVSGATKFPGQKADHVADPRSRVAQEEGYGGLEPAPRLRKDKQADPTLEKLLTDMETQGFRYRRIPKPGQEQPKTKFSGGKPEPKKQIEYDWKKVSVSPDDRTFTQDDVHYLAGYLPTKLSKEKKAAGKDYAGSQPYYLGAKGEAGPALVRLLLARGWKWAEPKSTERKITPSSMPDKEKSVTARMSKGKWWEPQDDEDDYGVEDDLDDVELDDTTDDLNTPDVMDDEVEDDSKDRWKW